jgi:hypothetical protein
MLLISFANIKFTNFFFQQTKKKLSIGTAIDDDIAVFFELFDKIGFYGNVVPPKDDEPNTEAIKYLKNAINNMNFRFNVTLEDEKVLFSIFVRHNLHIF